MFRFVIALVFMSSHAFIFSQKKGTSHHIVCENILTDSTVSAIEKELNELEQYFIDNGLLKDSSGTSYRDVFRRVKENNDLFFDIKRDFESINKLDIDLIRKCGYRLFTQSEAFEMRLNQVRSLIEIQEKKGSIEPKMLAQIIYEGFDDVDFELSYIKKASLLAFYFIASPPIGESYVLSVIELLIDEEDRLLLGGKEIALNRAGVLIYDFLRVSPKEKGILVITSRNTSYNKYLEVLNTIDSIYKKLRSEFSIKTYDMNYDELASFEKDSVKTLIPKNLTVELKNPNE